MKQTTLGSTDWALRTKVTRRAKFLAEMDTVIPWARLLAVIEPHYPKATQGRPPHPLPRMLRIYFMQQWFNLSDPGMEDALYDSESMRHFAGIDLAADLVPDETVILRFRHLLEQHRLAEGLFAEVRALLEEKKLLLKSGTIVDATIIAAPPSTKNAAQERDPEMKQTRKGKQWHFGMKLHVGTDRRGLVHSVVSGPASEGDITRLDELLHGQEREIFGDQAYWSEDHRQHCRHAGIAYQAVEKRGEIDERRGIEAGALVSGDWWDRRSRLVWSRSTSRALVDRVMLSLRQAPRSAFEQGASGCWPSGSA